MPDLEVRGIFNVPPVPERLLLKSHKTLPRHRQPEIKFPFLVDTSSLDVFDGIVNGVDVPVTPSLPLTPPNQIQEDTQEDNSPHRNSQHSLPLNHSMTTLEARSHQFSPPTPDVTPPRVKDTTPKSRTVFPSLQSSMSSRADSFQTARENFSDDDTIENLYPYVHSLVLRQRQKTFAELSPLSNGFDNISGHVEQIDEEGTESLTTKASVIGGSNTVGESEGEKCTTILASSPLPKFNMDDRPSEISNDISATDKEIEDTKSAERKHELRSTQPSQHSPEFSDVDKSDGKSGSDLTDTEQKLVDRVNTWRLSGGSITSTIEAMVIETSFPKKRTLRHTEKRITLRSVSSPQPQSTRMSTTSSTDSSHRLMHKSARISDQNRHGVASEISIPASTTSSSNPYPTEVIPVAVVPERRSSLKSSAPSTRNQSIARSTTSSRRKNSVPRNKPEDQYPPRRKRAVSDATVSTTGQSGREGRGRGTSRPPIPARSSSLSAPTSRNNSRSTSLTSESLRRHTEALQLAFDKPSNKVPAVLPSPRIVLPDGSDSQHNDLSVPASPKRNMEDIERLRAPSLHFTQSSVVSSSPGPIEISEATMVTYFPHNNKSLLVINPSMQPESQAVKALHGQNLDVLPVAIVTPEQSSAVLDADSPLRNPRTPPVPPVQKTLPQNSADSDGQLRNPNLNRQGSNRLNRGFGSVKRALSARRHSDSGRQQPMTWSLSVRSAKGRRAEKESDSQLYSFWRPRGFWDDFDSSPANEQIAGTPYEQTGNHEMNKEDVFVNNSLGLPQKRMVFSGPLVLAGRISKSRQSRHNRAQRQQYNQSNLDLAMGIVRSNSPYQRRTVKFKLRRGFLYPIRTFRNVRQRVRDARQTQARAALEARREKLKQSIGAKTLKTPYSVGPFNHGAPYEESSTTPRMSGGLY